MLIKELLNISERRSTFKVNALKVGQTYNATLWNLAYPKDGEKMDGLQELGELFGAKYLGKATAEHVEQAFDDLEIVEPLWSEYISDLEEIKHNMNRFNPHAFECVEDGHTLIRVIMVTDAVSFDNISNEGRKSLKERRALEEANKKTK